MKLIKQKTKTLTTRDNGRSSDAISPNFIYGCLGGCMSSYCYVGRFNHDKVYINTNIEEILFSIDSWSKKQQWPKEPNQVDPKYYCIDIGCSTDIPLHSKYYDLQKVFDFFNTHPYLKSTFATKYPTRFNVNKYNLEKSKHRIRISLMPQVLSNLLEPKTDSIEDRIAMIPLLQEKMEVHINFSPIVYYEGWLNDYKELFEKLKGINFQSECIFVTYNELQKERNSDSVNSLLWVPELQERKNSQYADNNIRYKKELKAALINEFKKLYTQYFSIETIRYIF